MLSLAFKLSLALAVAIHRKSAVLYCIAAENIEI